MGKSLQIKSKWGKVFKFSFPHFDFRSRKSKWGKVFKAHHFVEQAGVQCGAVCCSVLQCVAVCCSVLQCTLFCGIDGGAQLSNVESLRVVCRWLVHSHVWCHRDCNTPQHTAPHCISPHATWTATHCNTPQHTATHCSTLHLCTCHLKVCDSNRYASPRSCVLAKEPQHTAAHCSTPNDNYHFNSRLLSAELSFVKTHLFAVRERVSGNKQDGSLF